MGEGIYLSGEPSPRRRLPQNKRSEVSLEKPTPKAQSPKSRYKMDSMTFCDSGFNARVPQAQHECKGSRFLGFVVRESALESTLSELKGLHPRAALACRCSMSCAGGR